MLEKEDAPSASATLLDLESLVNGKGLARLAFLRLAMGQYGIERKDLASKLGIGYTGVNPIDAAWFVGVFDPVTSLGIVLDDFASTASALDVQLEEDGAAVPGNAQVVVCDEARDGLRREEGAEEGDEGRVIVGPDGTADDVGGNETEILRCAQNDRARCPIGPGIKGKGEKL